MDENELKKRRGALGMTQEELAEALGVHVMTISRWERGARSIPPHLALALKTVESERKPPKASKKRVSRNGPPQRTRFHF